ncbi:MAG TPA: hypothetical protein VNM47_06250 [Terriglobia bacterium]|nr:hypothetical protein [Terriglobia bacterium]
MHTAAPHFAPRSGIVSYLNVPDRPSISKRAARRLIQQAFVLTGRDRSVRQHIREARLETLWVLEDWNFEWTIILDRGKVQFERRPARLPDMTLTWADAADFLSAIQEGRTPDEGMTMNGNLVFRTYVEPVYRSFCRSLELVIKYPVDDAGNPLM